jgi:hypothetical protein
LSEEELARYACNDCGVNVVTIGEFYVLRPEIWEGQLGLGLMDNLCIGCLEARLGRRVGPGLADFCPFPVYPWLKPISDRLLDRYGFETAKPGPMARRAAGRQAEGAIGEMNRPSPRSSDKLNPTRWFIAIIIGLAVVALRWICIF